MITFDEMDKFLHWAKTPEEMGDRPRYTTKDGKSIEQLRDELWNKTIKNPLFTQYTQHIDRPHSLNTLPWHAIGERNYAVWQVLAASMSNRIGLMGFDPQCSRTHALVPFAYLIATATPYLWSQQMEKLADGAPLPTHTVSRSVLPFPLMFWSRESCYIMRDEKGKYEGETNWLCVIYSQDRALIIADVFNKETKELSLMFHRIPFKKTWPHDYEDDENVGRLLKRCSFLNSPYVRGNTTRLAHHHRRQMQRAEIAQEQIDELVHVVVLRRRSGGAATSKQPSDGVDYKHQWWVCGHHRAQWYPSEEAHKVIWIAPFIKGPEGAPMLEKIYSVVR